MTVVAPPPHRHDTDEAQLLFKEARRRRRRLRALWVLIALAVLGLAAGLGLGFPVLSRSPGHPHPTGLPVHGFAHLHTGVALVYAFDDLRVVNADTGTTRTLPMPAPSGGSRDLAMVRVGGSLLLQRGNTAWLYPDGVASSPADLGPSDGVLPGPNPNEAWIWSQPCTQTFGCADYVDGPQMGSVRLVDSSGETIGSPVRLPGGAGWYPTGLAGTTGLVLRQFPSYGNHNEKEEIWNPLTGHVTHPSSNPSIIGAAGNLVVSEPKRYCSGEFTACSVRVTDLKAGTHRTVLLPDGVATVGDAAVSRNHHTIALAVALAPRRGSRAPHREAVALINVRTGNARLLQGSRQTMDTNYALNLTWSTNGWLLFSNTVESSDGSYGFSNLAGTTVVRIWHQGERRAQLLPAVRLPKAQIGNEEPSLIAL